MTTANPFNYRVADTLKRLLRRGATANIRKILERSHPADAAFALNSFLMPDRLTLLSCTGDDTRQAEVLASMTVTMATELMTALPFDRTVVLMRLISSDDRADILGALDEEVASKILAALPEKKSDEVEALLRFHENTAGGIMNTDFLAFLEETSAEEAIRIIQDSPKVEMAFYVYVINAYGMLVGVVSLRQLVTAGPNARLNDIMNHHIVSVRVDEDQEEVARLVSRYDFLAVPVVEGPNRLVGVVTVDDVIDVILDEATEDILKMAGAGEEWDEKHSVLVSVKRRAPWLGAAWLGGIGASLIISGFEGILQQYMPLIAFLPIIIGMAGNVGTQSLTIVVRGLATRQIDTKRFLGVIVRELMVGVVLGILYGAALGGMGVLQLQGHPSEDALLLAMVVGAAAACAMSMATLVGTSLPLFFYRLHIDPAVATGPFVTTAIDIIGVLVYFNMARMLI